MKNKNTFFYNEEECENEIPPFCNQSFINLSFNDPLIAIGQIDSFIQKNNFNRNYKFIISNKEHNLLSYFFENKAHVELIRYLVSKKFTLKHLNEKRFNLLIDKLWDPLKRGAGELEEENIEHLLLLIATSGFNEYDKSLISAYPVILNYLYMNNRVERDYFFNLLLPALFESHYYEDKAASIFIMNLVRNDDNYLLDEYINSQKVMINILKSYTGAIEEYNDINTELSEKDVIKFMDYYFPEIDSDVLTLFLNEFYYIDNSLRVLYKRRKQSEKEILLNKVIMDYIMRFDNDYFSEAISNHLELLRKSLESLLDLEPVEILALEYYQKISTIKKQKSILNETIKVNNNDQSKGKQRI